MSGGEFCSRAPLAVVLALLAAAAPAHASFTARTSASATFRAAASFAPRAVDAPSISGTPVVGAPLVAHAGTWSPQPEAVTVRWELGGVVVATGDRYTPTAAGELRIVVTATAGGRTASAASEPLVVRAVTAPVNTAPPAISGQPLPGATLAGSDGAWEPAPSSFTRTWLRCSVACASVGTGASYRASVADIGYALRYRVTASNGAGSATAESAPAPVAPAPVGALSTSGLPFTTIRPALTTPRWTVNPALPVAYAWEWWRCPAPSFSTTTCSRAATTFAYTLAAADVGSYLRARHVATQNGVSAAQVTNAIGPVALLPPLLAATVTTNIAGTTSPSPAADGDTTTVWTAGATRAGDWLRLDFGAVRTLAAYEATYQPRPVAFEASVDGLAWTPIPVDAGSYDNGPGVDLRPFTARYLRLRVTTEGPAAWDVFDIRVWGS